MSIVKINIINTHLLQTTLETLIEEFRTVVSPPSPRPVFVDSSSQAKLCGKKYVSPTLRVQLEPLSEQDFAITVGICGVPVRVAELPGAVQNC